MTIQHALRGMRRLYLDAAPIIYYVQRHPEFYAHARVVFEAIDRGEAVAVTSPVVLAECLVFPEKYRIPGLKQAFADLILGGANTRHVVPGPECGALAAELAARHGLQLVDALHAAMAIHYRCDGLITNDRQLRRITEIPAIVLADHTA